MTHECPTMTIVNAVFGANSKGVPDEISESVRNCDKCFVRFYGEHLEENLLSKTQIEKLDYVEKIHFENCEKCSKAFYKLYPRPNKMGSSDRRYLTALLS